MTAPVQMGTSLSFFTGAVLIVTLSAFGSDSKLPIRMASKAYLSEIKKYSLPQYPAKAIQTNVQGLVVAEIQTVVEGTVQSVQIAESPDPLLSTAIATCLKTWVFQRVTVNDVGHPVRTRLFFYFRRVDGKPAVIIPGLTDILKPTSNHQFKKQ